jgi:hypothetical protein
MYGGVGGGEGNNPAYPILLGQLILVEIVVIGEHRM